MSDHLCMTSLECDSAYLARLSEECPGPGFCRNSPLVIDVQEGAGVITFYSWRDCMSFFRDLLTPIGTFIWCGHRKAEWDLLPSIDRHRSYPLSEPEIRRHLCNFITDYQKLAGNLANPNCEDGWWALGRHYGLDTPLLDWSRSWDIAAFFAYEEPNLSAKARAIFALNEQAIDPKKTGIRVVDPPLIEEPRRTAQKGIFTIAPRQRSLWHISMNLRHLKPALLKAIVPDFCRDCCLRDLYERRINRETLFPDCCETDPSFASHHSLEDCAKKCNDRLASAGRPEHVARDPSSE